MMTPEELLKAIAWLEERARQSPPADAEHFRKIVDELRWRLPDGHPQHPRKPKSD